MKSILFLAPHDQMEQGEERKCSFVILTILDFLPSVTFRLDFKVILLVYKSLNGLGPKYIRDAH